MGTSTEPWALDNERPAHSVELPAFVIDAAPVSNGEYAEFIAAGGYTDADISGRTPMGRFASPDDIAQAVAELAAATRDRLDEMLRCGTTTCEAKSGYALTLEGDIIRISDIIAYVKSASETTNPGGYGLGGFGPAAEGPTMWVIGIVAVVGAALWIGARS